MAQFSYRAIARNGQSQTGSIEADGPELATRLLRAQGLTLLALESGTGVAAKAKSVGTVTRQQVLSMTGELATLLRAGLPLDRALKVQLEMASSPAMAALLTEVLTAVKGGKAFSQALQPHSAVFGNFYLNLVRAGEASGSLPVVLDRLVEYLENAKTARESVVSALIYPAILMGVSVLSIFFMLGFVVPQFEKLFADMGDGLPLLTRMVVGGSDFIKQWWWLLAALLVGGGLYLRNWLASTEGQRSKDAMLLRLPVAGAIVFEFEVAKFARTAGTLLGNGVSMLQSMAIAIDTVDNRVIREALEVLPPAVKAGKRMSGTLEQTGMFTPMVIQMVRVGEESGKVDAMLLELAKVFDEHVASGVKRGLTLLEPILILGMGVIIALIIIAILMGIMSVNNLV